MTLNLDLSLTGEEKVSDYYAIGDKLAFNVTPNDAGPNGPAGLATFQLRGQQDGEWDGRWNADDAKELLNNNLRK